MNTHLPEPDDDKEKKKGQEPAANKNDTIDASKPASVKPLDAQMEDYEEHLKESDWGHQPC